MGKLTGEQYHDARSTTDYLIRNVPALPRILARHGYACLQTGKHWEADYLTAGFTHGMTLGRPATRLSQITGTRKQTDGDWVAHGNGDAGLTIGRETMQPIYDFIDDHTGKRPFFVWYAPFLPHTPFDAPARFRSLYEGKDVPVYLLPYYAEIARFDATVGRLLNHLQQQSLLTNTIIVFAGDNGLRPHQQRPGRHNVRSKLSQFEDGLRTPILIRWDDHIQPADHPQLCHTIDLVPTVLAAVGLSNEITPRMHGLNLLSPDQSTDETAQRSVFGAIYPNDAVVLGRPSQHVRGRWIRHGVFKLIVSGPAKKPLPLSLFDLNDDPQEQTNLASVPEHADRIVRMQRMLDQWWSDQSDDDVTRKHPE
jgi:arylsulfatase A